jgi:hypothetical protein
LIDERSKAWRCENEMKQIAFLKFIKTIDAERQSTRHSIRFILSNSCLVFACWTNFIRFKSRKWQTPRSFPIPQCISRKRRLKGNAGQGSTPNNKAVSMVPGPNPVFKASRFTTWTFFKPADSALFATCLI